MAGGTFFVSVSDLVTLLFRFTSEMKSHNESVICILTQYPIYRALNVEVTEDGMKYINKKTSEFWLCFVSHLKFMYNRTALCMVFMHDTVSIFCKNNFVDYDEKAAENN